MFTAYLQPQSYAPNLNSASLSGNSQYAPQPYAPQQFVPQPVMGAPAWTAAAPGGVGAAISGALPGQPYSTMPTYQMAAAVPLQAPLQSLTPFGVIGDVLGAVGPLLPFQTAQAYQTQPYQQVAYPRSLSPAVQLPYATQARNLWPVRQFAPQGIAGGIVGEAAGRAIGDAFGNADIGRVIGGALGSALLPFQVQPFQAQPYQVQQGMPQQGFYGQPSAVPLMSPQSLLAQQAQNAHNPFAQAPYAPNGWVSAGIPQALQSYAAQIPPYLLTGNGNATPYYGVGEPVTLH